MAETKFSKLRASSRKALSRRISVSRARGQVMPVVPLGAIPLTGKIGSWLLNQLACMAAGQLAALSRRHVERFVQDPRGSIGRVGDLLVWHGEQGQHVIATLEGLTESQDRIEQVVGRIETAQIGIAGSLGTLTSLSME